MATLRRPGLPFITPNGRDLTEMTTSPPGARADALTVPRPGRSMTSRSRSNTSRRQQQQRRAVLPASARADGSRRKSPPRRGKILTTRSHGCRHTATRELTSLRARPGRTQRDQTRPRRNRSPGQRAGITVRPLDPRAGGGGRSAGLYGSALAACAYGALVEAASELTEHGTSEYATHRIARSALTRAIG
jgi:hypothetical protein